jgi:protein gp37
VSEKTEIAWTDHTFNSWWGCVEVSPACDNCYARTDAKRYGHAVWGKSAPRRFFGDKHWNEPIRWNRKAAADGVRRRVFCASMADVFEDRPNDLNMGAERLRLWDLIKATPALDWLLLTKRPGNIERFGARVLNQPNVWLGTTVENRVHGLPRIDVLQRVEHSGIKFLSIEPLIEDLGAVDLGGIHWVIVGGESGHHARPFDVAWARTLTAQARAAGAAPFVKQLGARPYDGYLTAVETVLAEKGRPRPADQPLTEEAARAIVGDLRVARPLHLKDRKGGDPMEWPADLRVREMPEVPRG